MVTMNKYLLAAMVVITLFLAPLDTVQAADPGNGPGLISIDVAQGENSGKVGVVLQIFLLMTVLSLAPSILVMVTCFTRISIVLSLLRQAIGAAQLPPTQVIIGLSLFLTFFVMTPVWQNVNQEAVKPYLDNQLTSSEAFEAGDNPHQGVHDQTDP